jgi:glutathione S-transferase
MPDRPLRLYDYAASGNCYKVRLLLAQLGRSYERVPIDIFAGGTLTDEYAAVNPMRSTPVLETDDGRRLRESGAILLYLARATPYLPDDPFELAQVASWLIYEQTDVMPFIGGLRFRLMTGRLLPSDAEAIRRRDAALEVLSHLEAHLSEHGFFVGGRYTIADIAIYGYTHVAHDAGLDLSHLTSVNRWLRRVEEQPGYTADLEPYPENAAKGAGRSLYG